MKIKILTFLFAVMAISLQAQIKTPAPSVYSKTDQVIGLTTVTVEYSRPSMRGRTIFGNVVPYGKIWRTGANARTKVSFDTDVTINEKELKAGTYGLLTIPNKESWDIVFYTEANGGGSPAELDASKVALKVSAKPKAMSFTMESFTIGFGNLGDSNSGMMYIMWEATSVGLKIGVPTDSIAMKSIESVLSGPTANELNAAATYYYSADKDLKQALEWSTKAVKMNPDAFWMSRQKSLIQAKLGDKKGAIASAEQSLAVAEKAGNGAYVKMNKESIAEWSK